MTRTPASNGPGSRHVWNEVIEKLQQTEAIVYAVGIGTRVDRARLQELADRSGGSAFFPTDVTELTADYQRILDELRRRYALGYESSNRVRNGKWRNVEIRVSSRMPPSAAAAATTRPPSDDAVLAPPSPGPGPRRVRRAGDDQCAGVRRAAASCTSAAARTSR